MPSATYENWAPDLGKALPGIMLTTSLEQTAYSDLITRFLGERVIGKLSNQFLQFPRIVRRPARIAARIGNRHHDTRPLIRGENLQRMVRVRGPPSPPGEVQQSAICSLGPDVAVPVRARPYRQTIRQRPERAPTRPRPARPQRRLHSQPSSRPCRASTYARARVGRTQARQRFSPMVISKGWASGADHPSNQRSQARALRPPLGRKRYRCHER